MKTTTFSENRQRVYENPVIGDKVVFLETSRQSGGSHSLLEFELKPGGGNDPHMHMDYAETFTALEGSLQIFRGSESMILKPGESCTVPAKTVHYFTNPGQDAVKFQVKFVPGQEGAENALKIGYGLAKDGLTDKKSLPKKFSQLAILVRMSGIVPSGVTRMLLPLINWKARQPSSKAEEKLLMQRYCD